ncbi:hypothetical protein ACEWY4_017102 [Coilia grayii]|uniref:Integrase catalytic domain-containing protein n=1 Tax=Coilia grayii TaxID=363190 RepID=A0ABD1JJ83_9TELE
METAANNTKDIQQASGAAQLDAVHHVSKEKKGPFMGQTFLVLVDAHSKWLEAHIMSNITAAVTTKKLRSIFAIHGLPDTVVTDNGPTFTSEVFKEFMEKNGIRHVCTAPYHPASNGLAERAVATLKDGLRKMSGHSLETRLSRFLFQYRITPHTTTGVSPAAMLLGRTPKSHLDLLHPDMGKRVCRSQDRQKLRRDQHAKDRLFQAGDQVYVKNFATGTPWLPGVIQHQTGPVSFVVDLLDGRQVRRHQDHLRDRYDAEGEGRDSEAHQGSAFSSGGSAEGPQTPEQDQVLPEEPSAQGTLSAPTPNRLGGPPPAADNQDAAPELRRSTRPHRPPDRLTW